MRAIGWSLVLVSLSFGCTLDSGDGNGGPRPVRPVQPGAGCAALETALRNCGLITTGAFSQCEEPNTDLERCRFNCASLITCSELSASFCGQTDIDQLPPSAFTNCALACEPPPFVCGSGEQVSNNALCDGFQDCGDNSDEFDCASAQFVCFTTGFTIPDFQECDGIQNCPDGEDELDCGSSGGGVFACPDGFTIPQSFVCDGDNDCGDLSDEQNCPVQAELICPNVSTSPPPTPR